MFLRFLLQIGIARVMYDSNAWLLVWWHRGLDNAGKTTIVKRINGEDTSKISPTLGFNIKTMQYNRFVRTSWSWAFRFRIFRPVLCCSYDDDDASSDSRVRKMCSDVRTTCERIAASALTFGTSGAKRRCDHIGEIIMNRPTAWCG